MKYSVIKHNEVCAHDELRLEAEYYSPEYVALNKKLEKINSRNLGDFVDEIRCGPFGSTILCDTYDQNGVIVARPFNIKNCSIEDNNLAYVSEKDCVEKGLKIYKQGDIFFSRVGDIRCGIVPAFDNKITISPNIIAVRTNPKKLSPYYIAIFLTSFLNYPHLIPSSSL